MIKVLAYADAGKRTGFERVMHGIMDYLHQTGKFSIVVQGLGYTGNPEIKYDYPVYPAGDMGDPFGVLNMAAVIKKHNPDVMWMVQDLWNITNYMHYKPRDLPAVCYFPVDTPNVKWSYGVSVGAIRYPVAYTQFGAHEAAASVRDFLDIVVAGSRESGKDFQQLMSAINLPNKDGQKVHLRLDRLSKMQNVENWNVIPHGLDRSKFEPRDKKVCRELFAIPQDAFVVMNVNTNQFRKRFDLTFRIFAEFVKTNPKAVLVLHCAGSTERGWDLEQLGRYAGLTSDQVILIHQSVPELAEDELVNLYNCADVMINTAGGEGWGLTAFEGAACGIPQMVPDWSATRELWSKHGMLLPVADWRCEPKFLNSAHAIVDVKKSAEMLRMVAADNDLRIHLGNKALENAAQQPTWDQVGAAFERLLVKSLEPDPIGELTLQDLLDTRKGVVESELRGRTSL